MTPDESSSEQALEQLAGGFAHWRQTRSSSHERIPATLWEQAVALCQSLPLWRVARRLGLSSTDLKNRCLGLPKRRSAKPATVPVFVELPAAAAPQGLGRRAGLAAAMRVEFERPDGARMRLAYEGVQSPSLTELVRAFLEPA